MESRTIAEVHNKIKDICPNIFEEEKYKILADDILEWDEQRVGEMKYMSFEDYYQIIEEMALRCKQGHTDTDKYIKAISVYSGSSEKSIRKGLGL